VLWLRWGGAGLNSRSSGHSGVGELAGVGETAELGGASWLGRCGGLARVSWTSWRGQARLQSVSHVSNIFQAAGAQSMARCLRGERERARARTGVARWCISVWRKGGARCGVVARERACALWSCSGARDSGTGAAEAGALGVPSCRGQHGEWRWCPGYVGDRPRWRGAVGSAVSAKRGKRALCCSPLKVWLELGGHGSGSTGSGGERGKCRGPRGGQGRERGGSSAVVCSGSTVLAPCAQGVRRNASAKFKFEFFKSFWWVVWCWSTGSKYMASTKFGTGLVHISKYGQVLIC
jgi:hypothetical protein